MICFLEYDSLQKAKPAVLAVVWGLPRKEAPRSPHRGSLQPARGAKPQASGRLQLLGESTTIPGGAVIVELTVPSGMRS